ncbi:Hypothetical protein D9617_23g006220 [Elsinoe fawcettii]|nr:Hypothetical protein D9617_23g006220 [Elsinoe fawcettii]
MAPNQPKICQALLGLDCKHIPAFLSLPKPLRMKIYHLSGLPKHNTVTFYSAKLQLGRDEIDEVSESDATTSGSDSDDSEMESYISMSDDRDEDHSSGGIDSVDSDARSGQSSSTTSTTLFRCKNSMGPTKSLLLTCQHVYREISQYMYGRYSLRVEGDPSPLLSLRPAYVSQVKMLTINIHTSTCEGEHWDSEAGCCRPSTEQPCPRESKHSKPLASTDPACRTVLEHWMEVVELLSKYVTADRLDFYFICDVSDYCLALQFASPLLALPQMRFCEIRLGAIHEPRTAGLAKSVALRCVGTLDRSRLPAFNWLGLPREIRLSVLKYTNLITPFAEVNWSPSLRYHLIYSGLYSQFAETYPDCYHNGISGQKCSLGSGGGCFCTRYHSAYSQWCDCWSPPTALMLTSKEMLADSQEVFFRGNKFIALPDCDPGVPKSNSIGKRHPVSRFLRNFVPKPALIHLRHIEIVFPVFSSHPFPFFAEWYPVYEDWLRTIRFMKKRLRLPQLTLAIYAADASPGTEESNRRAHLRPGEAALIEETYERIIEPLAELDDLGRFFVYLAEPRSWEVVRHAQSQEEVDEVMEEKSARQIMYEHMIMGPEYSACKAGKCVQPVSQWDLVCRRVSADDDDDFE